MISYHFPLGLIYLFVLQLVLQDDPAFLNICVGWWLPSHLDIRVNPRQAGVQQSPVEAGGWIWLYCVFQWRVSTQLGSDRMLSSEETTLLYTFHYSYSQFF